MGEKYGGKNIAGYSNVFNSVTNTCDKAEVEEYISSKVDMESINICVSEIVEVNNMYTICYISNRLKIRVNFCCCTINVLRETHILETTIVGLYTWRGGGRGLKKCTVCTLIKMLTFLDGP